MGSDLLQQFEPFAGDRGFADRDAGGIAARPGKAGDKTAADGIVDVGEHDRDRPRLCEQGREHRPADAHDDVRV